MLQFIMNFIPLSFFMCTNVSFSLSFFLYTNVSLFSAMPRFPPCFHTMSKDNICCSLFVLDSAKDEYKLICNWLVLALLKDGHCSTSDFLLGPVHVYRVVVKVSDVHLFQPQTRKQVVPLNP